MSDTIPDKYYELMVVDTRDDLKCFVLMEFIKNGIKYDSNKMDQFCIEQGPIAEKIIQKLDKLSSPFKLDIDTSKDDIRVYSGDHKCVGLMQVVRNIATGKE